MMIVAFVGASDSGKTTLLTGIISELVRRGKRVSAVKHCPHGFDLDSEGKDTWKFSRAGAEGVAMIAPGEWAVLYKASDGMEANPADLAARLFPQAEVVIIEGGKQWPGLAKIEVARGGGPVRFVTPAGQLLAVVTDKPEDADAPVPAFSYSQIGKLCDFILEHGEEIMTEIKLEVDGRDILLNPFVRTFIENTVLGMVTSLDGVDPEPETVSLTIERKKSAAGGG